MSNNPFDHARSHQDRRLTEWEGELNEKSHAQAAGAAAQAAQSAEGVAITPVLVEQDIRGRLGGQNLAVVGLWLEIARYQCFEAHPVTIQSNVGTMLSGSPPVNAISSPTGRPGPGEPMTPRVMLRIRVGSGNKAGGGSTGEYFHPAGDAFQVSGTSITVDAQIFADESAANDANVPYPIVPNGAASVNPTTICPVSVTISPGPSPRTELPTKWMLQPYPYTFGSAWQVYIGPGRIKQAHGFNTNGTASNIIYLMFFDGFIAPGSGVNQPINGAVPMFTIPVPGASTPFTWDCIESSRFFQMGLIISPSTAPDIYESSTGLGAPFVVSVELYSGGMQQLGLQPYP